MCKDLQRGHNFGFGLTAHLLTLGVACFRVFFFLIHLAIDVLIRTNINTLNTVKLVSKAVAS